MKFITVNSWLLGSIFLLSSVVGCKKSSQNFTPELPADSERWITLAGALMQTEPGDGNGGTMVYSIRPEDAANPNFLVKVFDDGEHVKSNRTARLQSSQDGKFLYNIQY